LYKKRRDALVKSTGGPVVVCAAFTGLEEPGAVCLIAVNGHATLFVPQYASSRAQWVSDALAISDATALEHGFDAVVALGDCCPGHSIALQGCEAQWRELAACLTDLVKACGRPDGSTKIFTDLHALVAWKLCKLVSGLEACLADSRPFIAQLRRCKDKEEIGLLYRAAELTMQAQAAAACAIKPGVTEAEVQAALEYAFTAAGAYPAFPSIVASGKRATVLHATPIAINIGQQDCVVVDCGACVDRYCADVTRTYPSAGTFTARQAQIYDAVLQIQEHVASLAQPGYWLRNDQVPEKSLYHCALAKCAELGYAEYWVHSISHFVGLDVHDVGDASKPLAEGDVITIEPGLYLPQESLGVRIEDMYWIIKDGAICLTEDLPRDRKAIEELAQSAFE
jgi:Xaa-Pro aminopeptidase